MRSKSVNLYASPCFKGTYSILQKKVSPDKMDEFQKLICSEYVKNGKECRQAIAEGKPIVNCYVPEEYDCGFLKKLADTGIDFAYSVHKKTQDWFEKYLQSLNNNVAV